MLQHIFPILFVERKIGGGVFQNGFLIQIVLYHFRHEIVDALVVSDAVARGVQQRHVALAVDLEYMGNAN